MQLWNCVHLFCTALDLVLKVVELFHAYTEATEEKSWPLFYMGAYMPTASVPEL